MSDSKIKLRFADDQKSPTLDIGHGEYSRRFDVKDSPFECDAEEAATLLRTGYFVAAESKQDVGKDAAAPAPVMGKIGGAPAAVESGK